MKRKSYSILLAVAVLLTLLLAACGGATAPTATSPASQPTLAANVQPTTEPTVAPTDTPQPTTVPTAALPTPGNLPQDLANAVNKTRDALALRYEGTVQQSVTKNGKPVSSGGTISGEGNGTDLHITFSGTDASTGKAVNFDYIQTGGKIYLKGMAVTSKMDPNTWYAIPAAASALSKSAQNPKGLLAGFKAQDAAPANFQATGIDLLDLQPCEVWSAQNPTIARNLSGASNSDAKRELGAIDQFDVKLWVCADGYLHQMKETISGHDPKVRTDKETINVSFHIYDFGANIQIPAPANAQPFPS